MIRKIKKQPPKSTIPPLSALQIECQEILALLTGNSLVSAAQRILRILDWPLDQDIRELADEVLRYADFQIITYEGSADSDTISVCGSYKNYKGFKLAWTETYGDRPVMRYKHKYSWVGIMVCFFTLCLRTDTKLWLPERPTALPPSRPTLKRIKRAATRN